MTSRSFITGVVDGYVKHHREAAAVFRGLSRRYPSGLPAILACCPICRDDLLFEIELDAVTTPREA